MSKGSPLHTYTSLYANFLSQLIVSWVSEILGLTTGAAFTFTENSTFNFYQSNRKGLISGICHHSIPYTNTDCYGEKNVYLRTGLLVKGVKRTKDLFLGYKIYIGENRKTYPLFYFLSKNRTTGYDPGLKSLYRQCNFANQSAWAWQRIVNIFHYEI